MKKINKYILAFAILLVSLSITEVLYLISKNIPYRIYFDPIGQFAAFGPFLASLLFIIFNKKNRIKDLSLKWFNFKLVINSILLFFMAMVLCLTIEYFFKFSVIEIPRNGIWLWGHNFNLFIGFLLYAMLFLVFVGFGEELCWRGFLFNKLKGLSWLELVISINLIWSLWHLPVYMRYGNVISFIFFTVSCFEFGIILMYLRVKTNSVIPAMLLHALYNTIFIIVSKTMKPEVQYLSGFPNIIMLVVLSPLAIYYYKKGKVIYNERIYKNTFANKS